MNTENFEDRDLKGWTRLLSFFPTERERKKLVKSEMGENIWRKKI